MGMTHHLSIYDTLTETNIAPDKDGIPKENGLSKHPFWGQAVSFREGVIIFVLQKGFTINN